MNCIIVFTVTEGWKRLKNSAITSGSCENNQVENGLSILLDHMSFVS